MTQERIGTRDSRAYDRRIYGPVTLLRDLRRAWDSFPALGGGGIDRAFGEKIMLAVTSVNRCRYCSYGHARMALRAGISAEDVRALLAGDVGQCDEREAAALLFAQHYAESGAQPDAGAWQTVVDVYGADAAASILARIRVITIGNLVGNTFDALLWRLRGGRVPGSHALSELAVLALVAVGAPVLGVGMVLRRLAGA